MAEQPTEFTYNNIELYKWESLGSGSYGKVCKAKCDGLLCAAKIMHPTLFDLHDPGTASYLSKFQEECHLLSLARHPNVVQYLATSCDPDTRLPVLLMELCQKSLTVFLERSPGPLPHHIEVDISHDIALALVYLHSNGLIHRDLTGNNILMVAGSRAKITDFGMSKLSCINPHMTQCPGNSLYMSPEALDGARSYTAKLDIFSFGVIVIQILTRLFPNPADRFRTVHCTDRKVGEHVKPEEEEVRRLVPDSERRQSHLQLIPATNSLKLLALQCLKKKTSERPSALKLSERLCGLKKSSHYIDSMYRVQSSSTVQKLDQGKTISETKKKEEEERQIRISELNRVLQDMNRHLRVKSEHIQTMDGLLHTKQRELEQKQHVIAGKDQALQKRERELRMMHEQLLASEQLVSECHKSQKLKNKTIADLRQTISAQDRLLEQRDAANRVGAVATLPRPTVQRDIRQRMEKAVPDVIIRGAAVEKEDWVSKGEPVTAVRKVASQMDMRMMSLNHTPDAIVVGDGVRHPNTASRAGPVTTPQRAASKDISIMNWRKGKNAPESMVRGAAIVHGNTAFFRPGNSCKVYSYHNVQGQEQWSRLPDNPNGDCGLEVIDGLLTSVGGWNREASKTEATLLSLREKGERKDWCEVFPPMPTPRDDVACVTTEQALVVAGGFAGGEFLNTVEVMNLNSKQWTAVTSLPRKCHSLSATVCGDSLYLAGGFTVGFRSKSVFTCSLNSLLQTTTLASGPQQLLQDTWKKLSSLPVTRSSLVSFDGHLLAIGGRDESDKETSEVYRYDTLTGRWSVTSRMKKKRSRCIALTLAPDCLLVVGGLTPKRFSESEPTNSVEILDQ